MNVGQLKAQLVGIPDDALIVREGSDHSYRVAQVDITTAIFNGKHEISMDFGDDHIESGGTRKPVLAFL